MMKCVKYILFLITFMFINCLNIRAIEMTADKTSVNVGGKIEVQFKNSNSNSGYKLNYDSKYFNVENLCRGSVDISPDKVPCIIKFTVKNDLKLTSNTSTTISVEDIGNNANESASLTININKNINNTSSSENTTTTTNKTTTTTKAKSDNAYLKAISVIDEKGAEVLITPEFKKDTYEYSLEVDGDNKTVTINPQVEDPKANVILSNNAMEELKQGENNKITITVTAESGVKKAYILNIKREALNTDATISELIITEVPDFVFDPEEYEYDMKLKKKMDSLDIKVVLTDENSTYEIDGNQDLEDGSIIKILVTAQDGTKKEYRLNIKLDSITTTKIQPTNTSDKNPVIILILSMIAFALLGGIIYEIKKK